MLQPKKTKYRKMQKQKMKGNAHRGHELSFGSFAIKTMEEHWITGRQIEAAARLYRAHGLAGVGVAMQNAEEPVKAVADYVTAADNDHDGVAKAVEKFILK